MIEIPAPIKSAIDAHVLRGQKCGNFVTSVLENNLSMAVAYADDQNIYKLREIVGYCYNYIPGPCWGSKEAVKKWREKGGDPKAHIGP